MPCSMLGVKDIHGARTMGPPSGAELVSPTKRLAPHEKEPRLPPRERVHGQWLLHMLPVWLLAQTAYMGLPCLFCSRKAVSQGAAQGAAGPDGAAAGAPPARLHLH